MFEKYVVVDFELGKVYHKTRELSDFKSEKYFKSWNTAFAGKEITNTVSSKGKSYVIITVKGKKIRRSTLIYLTANNLKCFPKGLVVDHIDGNSLNDKITNLRLVTQKENIWNTHQRKDNSTGQVGVTFSKKINKFVVRIQVDGDRKYLGTFEDFSKAKQVYLEAKQKFHKVIGG